MTTSKVNLDHSMKPKKFQIGDLVISKKSKNIVLVTVSQFASTFGGTFVHTTDGTRIGHVSINCDASCFDLFTGEITLSSM